MPNPKVSVLMTVYNVEKYIRAALFSILNQTFLDMEVIIINDASFDNTESIILSFKDDRIKYLKNHKNLGISRSLNKGLKIATGQYLARMDGDDLCTSERIKKQVEFLDENKDHGLVGTWYYIINENGVLRSSRRKATEDSDIRFAMIFENQFLQSTVMMRTEIVKKLKYDPELVVCEDYDLFMRIQKTSKVANIPFEYITYRWYGENTSITKQKSIIECFLILFSRKFDDLGIEHSAEELFIHAILAFNYTNNYFYEGNQIQRLDNWLNKIKNNLSLRDEFGEEYLNDNIKRIRDQAIRRNKEIAIFES